MLKIFKLNYKGISLRLKTKKKQDNSIEFILFINNEKNCFLKLIFSLKCAFS